MLIEAEKGYQSGGDNCILSMGPTSVDTAKWKATNEQVVKAVVSIRFCHTCAFDTASAICSEATGFVVDAETGYILTNRHVVGPGPFWGNCIFDNHEECDVHPVYCDPVHDFGIVRFDPKAIKYRPVTALQLRPDLARVGEEIRIVGNDAGEKLSIHSGVISRLDRNAPNYGNGYNDFNTNYIQAAAPTSGGSSGSPVVNVDGYALALQAGGRVDAATKYFLPLDRPLRALQHIQRNEEVSRGTIQTQWLLKPFDECRRLGLTRNWETTLRAKFPQENNLLVAAVILPKGPAHDKLKEGDVLLKVNAELINQFERLDHILDISVGKDIKLLVQRNGKDIEIEVTVDDLHAITPNRFITVSGATFHDLSYQQACVYGIATKGQGVYVCGIGPLGFGGAEPGCLIKSIDNQDTLDLVEFVRVMQSIPDRARVVICYKRLCDLHTSITSIVTIDRHWYRKMRMAVRNDKTGLWDFTDLAKALPAKKSVPERASFVQIPSQKYPIAVEIIKSFVEISVVIPIQLDGFPYNSGIPGHGLVIDAERGLVVTSRATVPLEMCDIKITIAGSIIVEGKVVFLHPLQNYAIVQYDPRLVKAPVQTARLSNEPIKEGDETLLFGFDRYYCRPMIVKTSVTAITTVSIQASLPPQYRAVNFDAIHIETSLDTQCRSGVLVNEEGIVQALWFTYMVGQSSECHFGLALHTVQSVVDPIRNGILPPLRILDVELRTILISNARDMGVTEEWIERVEREYPGRHQLFMVHKVTSGHSDGLQESDIILSLNGKLVTRILELDIQYTNELLDAVVVRHGKQISIKVPTIPTTGLETSRALLFCGAILQRPHLGVRQQISKIPSEIYISGQMGGSPAYAYNLTPTNFITHVNSILTEDLDAFLREVKKIPDNTYFRLDMMTFDDLPCVMTMKKCEHYFPTTEFVKDEAELLGWREIVHGTEKVED